jgi:hypothetical protein
MKRLLEGEGSELERGLLDSLRQERPSPELEQRMRAALGLGPALVAAPEPSAPMAAAAPVGKSVGWSSIAAGSVAVALVVAGGLWLSRGSAPAELPATRPAPAPVRAAPPSEPQTTAPAPIDEAALRAEETSVEHAPAKSRPQHAAPSSASLREEIRLIDSARVAVKKNESARALGILDQYARRFPDGTFTEEARVLRSEAQKSR